MSRTNSCWSNKLDADGEQSLTKDETLSRCLELARESLKAANVQDSYRPWLQKVIDRLPGLVRRNVIPAVLLLGPTYCKSDAVSWRSLWVFLRRAPRRRRRRRRRCRTRPASTAPRAIVVDDLASMRSMSRRGATFVRLSGTMDAARESMWINNGF